VVARHEACEPFELAAGPVLRGELVRVAADDHVLLLTVHHIASDGWSSGVLVREVLELYPRFGAGGGGAVLAPLPVQYADFAVWQRGWLRGEVLADLVGYWRERLAGASVLRLPTDRPRPAVLSRLTGQTDVTIGTATSGRRRAGLESLVGFFVNTMVLRTDLSGDPTFRELLGRVRETLLGSYAHQDLPSRNSSRNCGQRKSAGLGSARGRSLRSCSSSMTRRRACPCSTTSPRSRCS
jgi:hypothetical protein